MSLSIKLITVLKFSMLDDIGKARLVLEKLTGSKCRQELEGYEADSKGYTAYLSSQYSIWPNSIHINCRDFLAVMLCERVCSC